ncbi:hypothetical protein EFA46_006285 [Halarchaeum sp. CBA1220]|uniref:hypothetical protein n=1 Tax=Halarchaeum sp. CBA1220 TaxID=1853682 RepID=UPI001314374C|nr:hypothetical protein [Halarchaeum sp. CBA1220]QLC33822.1 hypothetical protein EFA46_006285 [Halarchaeum sp. CBA1220]
MGDGGDSAEEALENALDQSENKDTNYWIRVALQRLVADRDGPAGPPPEDG